MLKQIAIGVILASCAVLAPEARAADGNYHDSILAADGALLATTVLGCAANLKICEPAAAAFVLTAPAMHASHGEWSRTGASAFLHALPVAGYFLFIWADDHGCGGGPCDIAVGHLFGPAIGVWGAVTATVYDGVVTARPSARTTTIALIPARGGGVLGWRGGF
jgi:hypothetical protein